MILVDADSVAGWRRARPSLDQLWDVVGALQSQFPDATIAVVGDPSFKWALAEQERRRLDDAIVEGQLVLSPAGAVQGHKGFLHTVLHVCRQQKMSTALLTDRAVEGARLVRMSRRDGRWVFDLVDSEISRTAFRG